MTRSRKRKRSLLSAESPPTAVTDPSDSTGSNVKKWRYDTAKCCTQPPRRRSARLRHLIAAAESKPHSPPSTCQDTSDTPADPQDTPSPLPLTKANLRALTGAQMAAPVTPSKTTTSTSIKPYNMSTIRMFLRDNNLFIDDAKAFTRCQEIKDMALEIIRGDRSSSMQPGSKQEIEDARINIFPTANELTFVVELWGILLHKTREVRSLDPQGRIEWIKRAWRQDYQRTNWNTDFVKDSVPQLSRPDDKILTKLLESLPRLQNPRPDLAYGLSQDAFDKTELQIMHTLQKICVLSNDLYHTFFIVEVKSAGTSVEEAENQCCRGGAALVYARMQFNAQAATELSRPVGADPQSIAFSLALTPSVANMFVHWAETGPKDVAYHMNLVKTYPLRDPSCEIFAQLRHDIDNVLDWGLLKRKQQLKDVCAKIAKKTNDAAVEEYLEGEMTPPRTKKRRRGREE